MPPCCTACRCRSLRAGLTTVPELRRLRHQQRRWPGIRGADDGIPLIDPLRETWLESFSFTRLWQLGVPLPECQVSVYDARGRFVGRVDGIWREHGTVAEADGAGKYLGELTLDGPSGAAAARLVLAEKIREDRLRDTGLEVVRWGFQDVRRAAPDLVQRVEAAWERGDLGRFRGRLVSRQPARAPEPHFVPVTRRTTADPAPERRLRSTKWV